MPATDARPHSAVARARSATRVQFFALGVLAGTWGAHIPSVKARYGLSDGTLSLVLLAAATGAVLSLLAAGRIVGRLGARNAAGASATIMSLLLGIVLDYPSVAELILATLAFGAAMSLFDVAINTEGSELESRGGRAIMSGFHGMFSIGGMAGAAVAAWLLGTAVAPRLQLPGVCAVTACMAFVTSRSMLKARADADASGPTVHFAWPTGLLLVIGLLVFAGMTAEGVMYDWSVLYLKQELGLSQARAALGYAAFTAAMALARFGGDALRARYSERALLGASACVAAVAMAIVLVSANAWVAVAGFALVGAGLAPVAPILYNAATRVPGVSRAAAIASVTSIGYAGFMIGPPLVGGIATALSLTMALAVVVLASAAAAFGARFIPPCPPLEQRLKNGHAPF